MNTNPQTLAEYQMAYPKLKDENTELQSRIADLEEFIRRYKAKFGPLTAEPRPAITRVRFDR
jgi:cell division septum initiation protein DivIVA